MIRLLLVRHGNTFEEGQTPVQVGSATDLPLTQKGMQQAERLARTFSRFKITSVFAGPLLRQQQTAQVIANSSSLPIRKESALNEIDYGPWEGLTSEAIEKGWPEEYRKWTREGVWPSQIFGRSLKDHLDQIHLFLMTLRKTHAPGDTIVAVGSNGIIRFFHPSIPQGEMEQFKVKTGHFCELHLYPDQIKVQSWNLKHFNNPVTM